MMTNKASVMQRPSGTSPAGVGRANNADNVGNANNVYGVAAPYANLSCTEVFATEGIDGRTYKTPSSLLADGNKTELWDQICSPQNITCAANLVIGYLVPEDHLETLRPRSRDWVEHRAEREQDLAHRLRSGYKFSDYATKKVYEPKERDIHYHSDWADNIAERAVINVIEPILNRTFSTHAFGSIKGRGTTPMMSYLASSFCQHPDAEYFQMDIRKYYEHVNRDILKREVQDIFGIGGVCDFMFRLIDSYDGPGIPIGAPLSQFHANIYLTRLDRFLESHPYVIDFARNMDDVLVISRCKEEAQRVRADTAVELGAMGLAMKPNWRIAPLSYGADIVGYVIRPTHVALRKRTKLRMQRRARQLIQGHVPDKVFKQQMGGYYGWATHGDCRHLLQTTLRDKLTLFNKKKRMDFKKLSESRPSSFFGLSKDHFVSITTLHHRQVLIIKYDHVTIKHVDKVAILFCYAEDAAAAQNETELMAASHYTITRSAVVADRLDRDSSLFPGLVTFCVGKYISYT